MLPSSFCHADNTLKTVIITGGANGIGAKTVETFYDQGYNVVISDLPEAESAAQTIIQSLPDPSQIMYVPTDILDWNDMKRLFRESRARFGQVDIVVANAGMMESTNFFDFEEDENGELKEPVEAYKVIEVNLKGTMNTVRLAMHTMRDNPPDLDGARGSIIIIASTSGYFGGSGVVSYVASKHGVVGVARASQRVAQQHQIRFNVIAPFVTPTHVTANYSERWKEKGLPMNTLEDVAQTIVRTSRDPEMKGHGVIIAGKLTREIEMARADLMKQWLGEDIADQFAEGMKFFDEIGGYPLPTAR